MLVPFIGTLLLFNQSVLDAVRIPEELIRSWGIGLSFSVSDASLLRLKLTYFGLCFLGLASFAFTLRCPEIVKRYGSAAEFVRGDEPLFTGPRVEATAGDIIGNMETRTRHDEFGRSATFACPPTLNQRTYALIDEIGARLLREQNEEEDREREARQKANETSSAYELEQLEPDATPEQEAKWWEEREKYDFRSRQGPGVDVDKLLNLIYEGNRADQWYYYRLTTIGREYPVDVMSLSYMWQDFSRPWARLLISIVYMVGFLMLSIPTAFTFASVVRISLF